MNQAVINAIIALLPTYQSASNGLRYLIGQLIRQYNMDRRSNKTEREIEGVSHQVWCK